MLSASKPTRIWESVVSICRFNGNSAQHLGSGTLFRIANASFVVTAAHIPENPNGKLFIDSIRNSFVALDGMWHCHGEPYDIAIHKLSERAVEMLRCNHFLCLEDTEDDAQSPTAVYAMFGYPHCWAKPSNSQSEPITVKPFEFYTFRYEHANPAIVNFDHRYHLLLNGELSKTTNQDGSPVAFCDLSTSLKGMSGCCVWRIGDYRNQLELWHNERPRIVGVENAVYKNPGIIKATRWLFVYKLIAFAYPELETTMQTSMKSSFRAFIK